MGKYQIVEISGQQAHAGTKATEDVTIIAERLGFKKIFVNMKDKQEGVLHKISRQMRFAKDWNSAYRRITYGSIVLLQNPFHYPQITREKTLLSLKKEKNVKFISVVHDVEELRTLGKKKYYEHEFDFMLQIADVLIVHNDVMKDFFVSKGVNENRLVVLKIFDYLRDDYSNRNQKPQFDKSIIIAGNLDVKKSGYLKELEKIDCEFYLYGPNFSIKNSNNIKYGGILFPNQIPEVMTKGFGLIWDGDSIDTCTGGFGNYLRYNNPHKLSLYISSGLPVFIWNQAAEANFVKKNNLGILISSLQEIPLFLNKVNEKNYYKMVDDIMNISKQMTSGLFMQNAIKKSLEILEKG